MQFQVPQFIETEDKVIGPFSIKQFIYVGVAAAFGFMLYFTVQTFVFALLSIIALGAALSLAFVKVEGRALPQVIVSAFHFYWKPQIYVWQPENPEVRPGGGLVSGSGLSLENIVAGAALRSAWKGLQSGTTVSNEQFMQKVDNRYEVFQRVTGERDAARRIDYR